MRGLSFGMPQCTSPLSIYFTQVQSAGQDKVPFAVTMSHLPLVFGCGEIIVLVFCDL